MNNIPSITVVDGFYDNPDEIRKEALEAEYAKDLAFYKGTRSVKRFDRDGLKERIESILGIKIRNWAMDVNTKYQYTTVLDPIIYHSDLQPYAGAIYLTPNAPPDAGTSFYLPRENGLKYDKDHIHYDKTSFNEIDKVANFYNRLVLWPGRSLHSATSNFGDTINNARLTQIFFFS